VVRELLSSGYEVVNVDLVAGEGMEAPFVRADMRDYGQTLSSLEGAQAVVHLAAIPTPLRYPPEVLFSTNVLTLWNVLQAAEVLAIDRVVLASSINAIGATFCHKLVPPLYFPLDEEHPTRAEDSYSLSKWVGEQVADGFARKRAVRIASLRLHGLWDDARLEELRKHPITDPSIRAKNFWGYIHLEDCARACRLALGAQWQGHEVLFINARNTVLSIPTSEALTRIYPNVPVRQELDEFGAVISTTKAERLLNWEPLRSWRDM
jgi:UDP-glucose 4-epimerase